MGLGLVSALGTGEEDRRPVKPAVKRRIVVKRLTNVAGKVSERVVAGTDAAAMLAIWIRCVCQRVLFVDDFLRHLGTCVFKEQ